MQSELCCHEKHRYKGLTQSRDAGPQGTGAGYINNQPIQHAVLNKILENTNN